MAIEDMLVVDADSHWSEPADMFTSRAPEKYRDQVPHVELVDGRPSWVFNGTTVGMFAAAAVIARDKTKSDDARVLTTWTTEDVHQGAYDPKVRLETLDETGIDHQVIFPSTIGLGGQGLSQAGDPFLQRLTIEIYNDAMAEIQADSGNRLLPMPLMPAYSVEECVREVQRCHALGLRGVNMTSDPQDLGAPDLASHAWDPFWAACADLEMPVHFHIGASVTAMTFFGQYPWASQKESTKLAIGGTMLFIGNARVVVNTILSGMFDRHPTLQVVSVESGVGWIPFILEALDYEMGENAKADLAALSKAPSEYFASNLYATFWFENNRNRLPDLIEAVGEDRILFETDFPHPTCLYPDPLATVKDKMETLAPETRAKIYGENARKLYRL
jgi:predicted TIM-barrel fold metal-dependent hydrolase